MGSLFQDLESACKGTTSLLSLEVGIELKVQFAIHLFEGVAGLNINWAKSTISPININKERADVVANCRAGFSTQFMPISYLGMPLR